MTIVYGPRYERVPAMFKALSNKNRRAILSMISEGCRSATEMAAMIGISQQAASRHILLLERAGLVARLGWEGYGVDAGAIAELTSFIQHHFRPPDRRVRSPRWM